MTSISRFSLLFLAINTAIAAPFAELYELVPRNGGVCGSGIYGEVVPIVSAYPIAQAFCSMVFPVKCTTPSEQVTKRNARPAQITTVSTTTTRTATIPTTDKSTIVRFTTTQSTTSKATTNPTGDSRVSAWSKCQNQPANVISTICSCIESPKACPTTRTTSTTTKLATTTRITTTSTTRPTTTTTTPTITTTTTTTSTTSTTTTPSTTTVTTTTTTTTIPTTTTSTTTTTTTTTTPTTTTTTTPTTTTTTTSTTTTPSLTTTTTTTTTSSTSTTTFTPPTSTPTCPNEGDCSEGLHFEIDCGLSGTNFNSSGEQIYTNINSYQECGRACMLGNAGCNAYFYDTLRGVCTAFDILLSVTFVEDPYSIYGRFTGDTC